MFRSLLEEGLDRFQMEVSLSVQNYIRELLIFFLRTENVFEVDYQSRKKTLRTFAEFYYAAQQSLNIKRNYFLK